MQNVNAEEYQQVKRIIDNSYDINLLCSIIEDLSYNDEERQTYEYCLSLALDVEQKLINKLDNNKLIDYLKQSEDPVLTNPLSKKRLFILLEDNHNSTFKHVLAMLLEELPQIIGDCPFYLRKKIININRILNLLYRTTNTAQFCDYDVPKNEIKEYLNEILFEFETDPSVVLFIMNKVVKNSKSKLFI